MKHEAPMSAEEYLLREDSESVMTVAIPNHDSVAWADLQHEAPNVADKLSNKVAANLRKQI